MDDLLSEFLTETNEGLAVLDGEGLGAAFIAIDPDLAKEPAIGASRSG